MHGLRRAGRRGLWNVQAQALLAATAMNLKRLAVALLALPAALEAIGGRIEPE